MPKEYKPEYKLREGEYMGVTPIMDSHNGEAMGVRVVEKVNVNDIPVPPLYHPQLHAYLEEMFRDVKMKVAGEVVTGVEAALQVARVGSWKYPSLAKVVAKYEDLCEPVLHPEFDAVVGRPATLEHACQYEGVDFEDFLAELVKACYWYGIERAKVSLHIKLPQLIEAIADNMILPGKGGFADRRLLAEMGGLAKTGTGVTINNTNNVKAGVQVVGLPRFEESDKVVEQLVIDVDEAGDREDVVV